MATLQPQTEQTAKLKSFRFISLLISQRSLQAWTYSPVQKSWAAYMDLVEKIYQGFNRGSKQLNRSQFDWLKRYKVKSDIWKVLIFGLKYLLFSALVCS